MHPLQMSEKDTGLLVIDVQEKLVPFIFDKDTLIRNIAFLIDGARLLNLPVQATEQYPKGLGSTVPELAKRLPERPEKVGFSSCAVPAVPENFRRAGRNKIVLAGIETHVCVLHTAMDLLSQDFRVYVPVDAVGSRYRLDHEYALRRMEKAGAILTTAETCLFEWLGGSNNPSFKQASKMVQERMKQLSAGA